MISFSFSNRVFQNTTRHTNSIKQSQKEISFIKDHRSIFRFKKKREEFEYTILIVIQFLCVEREKRENDKERIRTT